MLISFVFSKISTSNVSAIQRSSAKKLWVIRKSIASGNLKTNLVSSMSASFYPTNALTVINSFRIERSTTTQQHANSRIRIKERHIVSTPLNSPIIGRRMNFRHLKTQVKVKILLRNWRVISLKSVKSVQELVFSTLKTRAQLARVALLKVSKLS